MLKSKTSPGASVNSAGRPRNGVARREGERNVECEGHRLLKGSGGFVESGGMNALGPPSPAVGRDDPTRLAFSKRVAMKSMNGRDEIARIGVARCTPTTACSGRLVPGGEVPCSQ